MPNYVHGILIIDKTDTNYVDDDIETRLIASIPSPTRETPSTTTKTKPIGGFAGNKNPMINKNISRVIRWDKGRCSFEIRKIHADFEWQPHFYDHIIQNNASFNRIQKYIENKPAYWKADKFY